jgi:SAM-dependent methyltransferase
VGRVLSRSAGRRLFGTDPDTYDAARPGHAEWVYELLHERCGLTQGSKVLEVGPGTGQATQRLLELGAGPLVAVEPDPNLGEFLRARFGDRIELRSSTLEDAELETSFELAVAASSFHWVEEDAGLRKIAATLAPGGWWVMWWTLFGVPRRKDAFMQAVDPLLEDLPSSPSGGSGGSRPSFALDFEARGAALARAGFELVEHELVYWPVTWDSDGIRGLYATFSPIIQLDDDARERLLDEIRTIAERDFGGRVGRTLTTSIYTARKPL